MINIDEIWNNTLDELSKLMQVVSFEVWVQKLEPVCVYQNKLVLCSPTKTAKKTVETRYSDVISEVLTAVNPQLEGVVFITDDQKDDYIKLQREKNAQSQEEGD